MIFNRFQRIVALSSAAFFIAQSIYAVDLIVHEWGTFTSIQGSDGRPLRWSPFVPSELPNFVYSRNAPLHNDPRAKEFAFWETKGTRSWFQRMETPVLYFYAAEPMDASVQVGFPEGLVTEWYPQASEFGPMPASRLTPRKSASYVHWDIRLFPAESAEVPPFAQDKKESHYFAARETDSASLVSSSNFLGPAAPESEKLLFYRGVGDFSAPLNLWFDSTEALMIENKGTEELSHLFVIHVGDQSASYKHFTSLPPNAKRPAGLSDAFAQTFPNFSDALAKELQSTLVGEGLFPKEAAAMVKTWKDAWLSEKGDRVLYMLPRAWTDRILPITVNPAPQQMVRVMVGRAEFFSPNLEKELETLFTQYHQPFGAEETGDSARREQAVAKIRALGLGRFADPALTRVQDLERERLTQEIARLQNALNRNEPH
jgi:hypothetical protein